VPRVPARARTSPRPSGRVRLWRRKPAAMAEAAEAAEAAEGAEGESAEGEEKSEGE
jgi:hypothetical protein